MTLRARFTDEIKTAMKAGDKTRVSTIRMVQAALKDKDIEARGGGKEPIPEDEILALLQKMLKQRQESIAIYDSNARPELAAAEREEAAIIQGFLPQPLGESETEAAIEAAVAETGASSVKDMGKVIAKLRADYAGRMDFGRVSGLVKARLSGA
ncbi:GatB/YqeY domain-containing protein [Enterovirga sp.]|jgi:uncharacterized protein YqeY|uniref:GatB/YqeY domain-containing protein n=1 Tax=Enterovirga sp. TaxID=2026350 RepID=UPI002604ED31|nr:GatB/YqeY domain-containing protein [Enterovirga sp.]MDB5592802.1 GatB/YqeY [Enterovirga sp.]